ncbi:MAG: hypothetical protein ACHQ5A_03670, partial [Opitutales bacterium]
MPTCPLRVALVALAPEARARALARLARLNPPQADFATLHVTPNGYLYYVCDALPPTAGPSAP